MSNLDEGMRLPMVYEAEHRSGLHVGREFKLESAITRLDSGAGRQRHTIIGIGGRSALAWMWFFERILQPQAGQTCAAISTRPKYCTAIAQFKRPQPTSSLIEKWMRRQDASE